MDNFEVGASNDNINIDITELNTNKSFLSDIYECSILIAPIVIMVGLSYFTGLPLRF